MVKKRDGRAILRYARACCITLSSWLKFKSIYWLKSKYIVTDINTAAHVNPTMNDWYKYMQQSLILPLPYA